MSKYDSKYSDDLLCKILDAYWAIKDDNEIPAELIITSQQRGERAKFESAAILLADVNNAMDSLLPGRWSPICQRIMLDDFWTDITRTHHSAMLHGLGFYQQAVARYHWLQEQEELNNAARARKMMLGFLNHGTKPYKDPYLAELGRQGGLSRARNLTPEKRSEIARQGAEARWSNT